MRLNLGGYFVPGPNYMGMETNIEASDSPYKTVRDN